MKELNELIGKSFKTEEIYWVRIAGGMPTIEWNLKYITITICEIIDNDYCNVVADSRVIKLPIKDLVMFKEVDTDTDLLIELELQREILGLVPLCKYGKQNPSLEILEYRDRVKEKEKLYQEYRSSRLAKLRQ